MTPVGQPYHASGPINIRSITATLILGALTAVLAAMVVWLWEISPIPTFVIITQFAQALLIGWVLAFAIGRLRMRNPGLVLIIGFACGLASVGLVHLGHYIRFVDDVATHYRAEVLADKTLTPEQRQEALAMADTDRWRIAP
jgi:carbon starvation protein CstA